MPVRIAVIVSAIALCVGAPHGLLGQTAMLFGVVVRDSAGHEIPGAQLLLPGLSRSTTANYLGEYKFERLPAGRLAVVVRHVGFAPLYDTLEVREGARIDREFMLSEQATQLDSVQVTAMVRTHISPGLTEFEERRKAGFGHFITDEELRKNDDHALLDVLVGKLPGIKSFPISKHQNIFYIASGRKCAAGPALLNCKPGLSYCPVTLYVDGVITYDASGPAPEPPDIRQFDTRNYAAVEYYAGGATTPLKYNATSSGCGVLLLWSRER